MSLDDVARDRQPETGSTGVASAGVIESGEALEHALSLVGFDPRAVVRDGQPGERRRVSSSVTVTVVTA